MDTTKTCVKWDLIVLGSIMNNYVTFLKIKRISTLHFEILHLNFDSKSWNDLSLCDMQLLSRWDNFQTDQTARNVFESGMCPQS